MKRINSYINFYISLNKYLSKYTAPMDDSSLFVFLCVFQKNEDFLVVFNAWFPFVI
jgi:hypothetical protein